MPPSFRTICAKNARSSNSCLTASLACPTCRLRGCNRPDTAGHDEALAACLIARDGVDGCSVLGVAKLGGRQLWRAQLLFVHGGLGLRAALNAAGGRWRRERHKDGVGAFDTVSRLAMLSGLSRVPGSSACLPFVRQFYAARSRFLWHDAGGRPRAIDQAEGGEQGDPLMPALYALGQYPACFPTSMTFMSSPPQPRPVWFSTYCPSTCAGMRASKYTKAKTRAPGSSRQASASFAPLTPRCGSVTQPCRPSDRGSMHLRFPVSLLQGIRSLPDLQSAWLLLLFCASPRCCGPCHLWLRSPLRKPMTRLSPPALRICWGPARSRTTRRLAQLPFQQGLRSAVALPIGPRGPTLFPCCTASSRASPPTLSKAWSRRARRPTLQGVLSSHACCGRV